ncbi:MULTISPECIES: flagellar protein FliT [Halorhodospira]|uniref:flagellar protein FliT n=1 Tax=Halorhodospira TaxID=85108 RepID=UPI001EE84203|nr:flagellar protein FliT [Halorhodospira halophila]MCG5538690.1 flagellar protein FliT [Halorhodospira sp. 9622]MCG5541110.1 flagellar protein FliT [Halorhodospira sp. M39old]MCG5543282.1 flagellar protein FliT [Halorhodospira sp. 9628]MCG5545607.1 flagellar protein FliT [Halorhodospira sp. M38]
MGGGSAKGGDGRAAVAASARRLLELSRQMRRCAEAGDWDGVMERNGLRQAHARGLPEDPDHPGADLARRALAQSLECDRAVRALMEAERDRLGAASRDEQHHREVHDAYSRCSG